MNIVKWLREKFSTRGKALGIYRSGMNKAKHDDPQGAIAAYSQVIEMSDAPVDVIAMALFNRGLVYAANGETNKGVKDLNKVLDTERAPVRIKELAKQKLVRMKNIDKKYDTDF